MHRPKTDPILPALTEQVACYQRLAKLAEAQHEYVQQSQTELLLEVLARRQEVLDQAAAFERVIAPIKGRWSEYLGTLDAPRRKNAESLMAETRRLLGEITAADRNDALVLQQQKLNLGRQINQAQAARTVNKTYAASAYGGVRRPRMDMQR